MEIQSISTSGPFGGRNIWGAKAAWLGRRILLSIVMLGIVSVLIFAATQALPGDVAQIILGKEASAEQVALVRQQLRLDAPLYLQYWHWLSGILTGDLGGSLVARIPVWELVRPRIANSFTIVILSTLAAVPTAILVGVLTAYNKDGSFDRAMLGLSMAVNALPEFVLGLLLVVVFSTSIFQFLPAVSILTPDVPIWYQFDAIVLPVATIFLLQSSYLYRLVRASVIDVLDSEYIQLAMLKGLPTHRILFRHALPNAIVPAIQAAATTFAFSVGGVVVVEYVFGFPGIGTALTDAVGNRDVPVVQFIVLLIAVTFFVANLFADVLSTYLTPPGRGGRN